MKKIVLLFMLMIGYTTGYSQLLLPEVTSAAGNYFANENYSISWTLGECITETVSNNGYLLTQGFQQSNYDIETIVDNSKNLPKIILYPNPATDFIQLEMPVQDMKKYHFKLLDMNGKCLKNEKITTSSSKIDLKDFVASFYVLNVFSSDNQLIKSFKIIKIN